MFILKTRKKKFLWMILIRNIWDEIWNVLITLFMNFTLFILKWETAALEYESKFQYSPELY